MLYHVTPIFTLRNFPLWPLHNRFLQMTPIIQSDVLLGSMTRFLLNDCPHVCISGHQATMEFKCGSPFSLQMRGFRLVESGTPEFILFLFD